MVKIEPIDFNAVETWAAWGVSSEAFLKDSPAVFAILDQKVGVPSLMQSAQECLLQHSLHELMERSSSSHRHKTQLHE